jgi:Leucine-rich repeat (LRR) protein
MSKKLMESHHHTYNMHFIMWRFEEVRRGKKTLDICGFAGHCFDEEGVFPEEICEITDLEVLMIEDIDYKKVPDSIVNLTKLKTFDTAINNLDNFPVEILDMSQLTKIYFYNNQISEIPDEISKLHNLEDLTVSSNNLTDLPEGLFELSKLKKLHLYSNKLTKIPAEIGNLTNLKELNIARNPITELPDELFDLDLETLDVNRIELSDDDLERIKHFPNLKNLTIDEKYHHHFDYKKKYHEHLLF